MSVTAAAPIRVLVVDDELLIRENIRRFLQKRTDFQVIGECETGRQAIEAIPTLQPDLVLLDVQMHDGTGIDVVQEVGVDQMPPIIFVTAFDEYAVQAFELNAIDYLMKPFDEDRLNRSLDKAKSRIDGGYNATLSHQLRSLLKARTQRWPERIAVRTGERFDMVPVEQIEWIESANNYVQLHCGPKDYLLGETLANLLQRIDPSRFLRVHRCRAVNLSKVVSVHPLFSGTYELELSSGMRLQTGRLYREHIQALLRA